MGRRIWNEYTMGVCYYPEHWPKELWENDLDRMLASGITVIRIAEFAWSIFEKTEGNFDFSFFDEFLELCAKKNMKVIMGTPTATPPAWLTRKYPSSLNALRDGTSLTHGARRQYNYNSPDYQRLSKIIVTKMAEHYGKHPMVVGWQIDNELNCETDEFYSKSDAAAFREFLKKKYQTLDCLNETWGTVFWSQTYTDWEEISVPGPVLNDGYNPHYHLDYYRFVSESARRFCQMQSEILRKYIKPTDFITTNGLFGNLDNHKMTEESLDVYTYDTYPSFAFELGRDPKTSIDLNDRKWTRNLIEVRSISEHFGIMEHQSGGCGWTNRMEGPTPRPGQLNLWAMQSVSQGADFISFFRWRTCTFGTEMYWHGILNYDNRDNRKLREVQEFYRNFKKIGPVCGAKNTAAFGLLKDYDNEWDAKVDHWHGRLDHPSDREIFVASELNHTPYDMIYLNDDTQQEKLNAYPVLIYPHPLLMNEIRARLLENYVEQGGILILGCRSGLKDMSGRMVMMPQPGLLQKLTGSDVVDFTFASPNEDDVEAVFGDVRLEMPVFHDVLKSLGDSKVLAVYDDGFYKGEAALIENSYGKGRVLHFGSTFSRQNVKAIFEYLQILEPFADVVEAPEEVQIVLREKEGRKFYFVLNYMPGEKSVTVKRKMKNLLTDEECLGAVKMPAFGVMVLEEI